ncbi:hypothetical protein PFISCL1PPCAC_18146 [Pristionchus fissidentatus]|uniref:Uncharacterized protein n=1 Tax=Pristionchus fissidentatus TaxID=1538716 RepID=A0AAV5W816_9BILA|nr:hypothetical protein PFISCL1PPCAC_18146 [Pristionchus fissidentatus]
MIADRSFNQYTIHSSSTRYLTADFGEGLEAQFRKISLKNFELLATYHDVFAMCTLDEFLDAAERRIKVGKFTWSIALSNNDEEIRATIKERSGQPISLNSTTSGNKKTYGYIVKLENFDVHLTRQSKLAKFVAHVTVIA